MIAACIHTVYTGSVPVLRGGFGEASSPIFLRALGCVGTENTFLQCPRASVTFSTSCGLFSSTTVAAVICTGRAGFYHILFLNQINNACMMTFQISHALRGTFVLLEGME